jgi:hypothetical protein
MEKKLVCLMIWIFLLGAASANAQTTIRVNAAGSAYTDSKGKVWSADFGFNGYGSLRSVSLQERALGRNEYSGTAIYISLAEWLLHREFIFCGNMRVSRRNTRLRRAPARGNSIFGVGCRKTRRLESLVD